MSAIGGERDVLLQATAERFSTVAEGKNIVLTAVPPLFHLDAAGAPTEPSITVTAKPINLVGPIEFSATGATLSVNGNVATVDFANVTAGTVVVQAKIREFGVDHIYQYVIGTVRDGTSGAAGINTAQAFAYKRAAAAPTDSPGDVIYTFASGAITTPAGNDLANGWSKNIPSGTAPLYVRVASASSRNATDNIAGNEWSGAVQMAANGLSVASVRIYQRGTTNLAPALPTAQCTFEFATGAMTGLNNGWSGQLPVNGGAYLFTSGATAASASATDVIEPGEWAAAARLAADGAAGQRGTITVTAPGYSTWSDASAVYEIGAAGYGVPINRDMVTLYDATHSVTKFYVDGSWLDAGSYINGNLLVDGTIAARALAVDDLAAITGKFSRMTSGDIEGAVLHGGTGYPYGRGYNWPDNGGIGFHLSADGLLMGNPATGRYTQIGADGNIQTPQFTSINGQASFSGNVKTGVGTSFRIEMGPDDPVYAMWAGAGAKTDANAIFYLKRSGAGYFGGSLSAGTLRTAVTNPTLDANAQLVDGPFGTNGSAITVVCSYTYNDLGEASGGTYAASGAENSATIQLYRTIAGGSETLVQTVTASGTTTINNAPAGSGEFSRYQHQMSASFTYTDNAGGSQNRTYRAVLSNRTLKTVQFTANPGETGQVRPQGASQALTIITTE